MYMNADLPIRVYHDCGIWGGGGSCSQLQSKLVKGGYVGDDIGERYRDD